MTITNPSIVLSFTGGDLPSGHSSSQTITSAYILARSITFNKQLLNGLAPSSNRVSLKLRRDCPSLGDIKVTNGNIQATLKSGNNTIFTGYVSTSLSWGVNKVGTQDITLTLEDVGTRLLTENFIDSGYHTFNSTAEAAVRAICTRAGVTVSSSAVFPSVNVVRCLEGAVTCKELLSDLFQEMNCVYYFNNLGQLMCKEISCTSVSSLPTFDRTNLYAVGSSAVTVSKSLRQYKNSKVTYSELGDASNYCVFRAEKVSLGQGQSYDGLEVYTPTPGTTRSPAYVEAVNALSEQSLVGSNKIVFVSNPTIRSRGAVYAPTLSVTAAGGRFLNISATSTSNITQTPTIEVYGSIKYVKSTNVISTANTSNNDQVIEETLDWVHDKTMATKHANLLAQYYKNANTTYTFKSTTSVALGSIVRLHENVFSGLDVNVILIASVETDESGVIQYTAVGISVMNLTASVTESRQSEPTKSEPIISTQSTVYADEGAQVTATGEFAAGATFTWYVNKNVAGSGTDLDIPAYSLLYGDNLIECVVTEGASTNTISTHVTRSEVAVESEIDMDSTNYSDATLVSILNAQCEGNASHKKVVYRTGSVRFDGTTYYAPITIEAATDIGEYGCVYIYKGTTLIMTKDLDGTGIASGEFLTLSNVKPPFIEPNIYGDGEIGQNINGYYDSMSADTGHFGNLLCDVEDQDEGGTTRHGGNIGAPSSGFYDNAYIQNVYIKKSGSWHKITDDGGSTPSEVFRYATSVAVNQSGDTTITFPTAFPSGCYSVVVSPDASSTASYTQRYHIHSITSTGFKFYQRARCIDSISYIAIGH